MPKKTLFLGPLLALGLLSVAFAQQQAPVDEEDPGGYGVPPGMGYGMGPGMMGYGGMGYGMGPGMMGYGMGPGMMGYGGPGMMGYGMGPGMMGPPGMGYGMGPGYGMRPGMMGGYGGGPGYGPGAMGGYGRGPGYGPGAMGGLWTLNLTEKQQQAINDILNNQRQQHVQAMSRLADQYAQLRQLYAGGKVDENAVTKIYDQIFTIRRDLVRNRVQTHNQIYDQLTDAQRQQLRQQGWGRLGW